jgi:carboxyl-terminal processing protease
MSVFYQWFVGFGVFLALSLSPLSGQTDENLEPPEDPAYEGMRVLANAIQLIRQDYVTEDKIDYKSLVSAALRGMLSELDPHSQFLEGQEFKSMQEDTKSTFGGLGIQVSISNGTLVIISPMEGGPGFEAGLLPNDEILKIDGVATDRLTQAEAVDLLRGEVGEKVTLTIRRPETREIKDFTIERAIIKVTSVRQADLLPEEITGPFRIGYVRITQFSEPTSAELAAVLDELEAEGMEALVLDLRYNPGGLLSSAVEVCGEFLPPSTQVVFTAGRNPSRPFSTPGTSRNRRLPVAILINYASASGSEIVAGALKDLGRAVLVGETTFGKGSVQSVRPIQVGSGSYDGAAIRLTTHTYLTPSKSPIHEVGVAPHIRASLSSSEERLLLQQRRKLDRNESRAPDGSFQNPDPQLSRAVDALRGTLLFRARATEQPARPSPSASQKDAPEEA